MQQAEITCYILTIDCLLFALDGHMFSHNGYGLGTKALVVGPGPIFIMAEHMCIKGDQ